MVKHCEPVAPVRRPAAERRGLAWRILIAAVALATALGVSPGPLLTIRVAARSSALISHIESGSEQSAITDIKDGADIDACDDPAQCWLCAKTLGLLFPRATRRTGRSALELSFDRGQRLVARELILRGAADVDSVCGGEPLVVVAASRGWSDVGMMLIARQVGYDRYDLLKAAAEHGDLPIVRYLLQGGASAAGDPTDPTSATPLDVAAMGGNDDIALLLLHHGADVNARSPFTDGTPLMYGAAGGHTETVRLLLRHGAAVNVVSNFGTALHDAAERGDLETATLLVSSGADVNLAWKDTPLQAALRNGHHAVASYLVSHGARR